jgi:hypothetical protein
MRLTLGLSLLLIASASYGQFLFKANNYRIRQVLEAKPGAVEKLQVIRGKANIILEEDRTDETNVVFGELPKVSDADLQKEIDNFKRLYNLRSKKFGWRKRISLPGGGLTTANTTAYLNILSKRRQTRGVSPQMLSGLYQKLDNNLGRNASNFFELGSRISDLRLKTATTVSYRLESDAGKNTLVRKQRERFLYFDFISRGVLALDSMSTTVNEYVNSLQGAPLSVRLTQQFNLSNPVLGDITGAVEPLYFIDIAFDGRLVPVTVGREVTSAGGSFHLIPSFTAAFPSGKGDDAGERDRLVVQLSGNLAYVTEDAANVLYLGQKDVDRYSFSFEARVGLFSEDVPTRNFNFLFRYNAEKVNGARSSLGFTFAPQAVTEKRQDKD